jgi:hypothetical protein
MLEKIRDKRVAMISGWAVDPNAVYRYQVDAAFPLSDHADYTDLLRYVELVQPQRVLTLHGFAAEFARDLRDRGVEAWALSEQNQLELTLNTFRATTPAGSKEQSVEVASEFRDFAKVGEAIAGTPPSSKNSSARGISPDLEPAQLPSRPSISPANRFPKMICAPCKSAGRDPVPDGATS